MVTYVKIILQAIKIILANKKYRLTWLVLVPLVFFLLVAIPVNTIPSNDFKTQFSLYQPSDYVTLVIISSLLSLFILMHAYNFRRMRLAQKKARALGIGGIGGSTGALASIFGAAACPMCVASIFGFLGFGAVGAILRYQQWIFGVSFILMLFSLYLISKKVIGVCDKCPGKN